MDKATVAKKVGLTESELTRLASAMWSTWVSVGDDWLRMIERSSAVRSEVLEAVVDADRLRMYGGRKNADVVDKYYRMDRKLREKVDRYVFPNSRYGW